MAGLAALVILIFSQQVEFTASDLGRHLANGREIWRHPELLFKNFYSFTAPDFPFVNHHWLSGLIYYRLYLWGGFAALSAANIALGLGTFLLAFRLARRRLGFAGAAWLSLPAILLLSERVEVRPEIFSYFFVFLVWTVIDSVRAGGNRRWLFALPPIFILWANLHIYFFAGLALLLFSAGDRFLDGWLDSSGAWPRRLRGAAKQARMWLLALAGAAGATLINPNTWRGLLYPFTILREYGYEIAENKSPFFMEKISLNANYGLFRALLLLLVVSWIMRIGRGRRPDWFELAVSLFFSGLAIFAVRNLALFGLAAWVVAAANLSRSALFAAPFYQKLADHWQRFDQKQHFHLIALPLVIAALLTYLSLAAPDGRNFFKQERGWGAVPNSLAAIDFYRSEKLSGPIFNNYDIGSALIFWLAPEEKVFVDNRPEAYPAEFFRRAYKPMQEEASAWQEAQGQYGFKTIFFSHTDSTPWARQFLRRILHDANWRLVYLDHYALILVEQEGAEAVSSGPSPLDLRGRLRELARTGSRKERASLASLAADIGESRLALEIYRAMLAERPDEISALTGLASTYSQMGGAAELELALRYWQLAQEAGYKLPEVHNQIGLIRWERGEYEKAEASWRTALKQDHKNVSAKYYLDQVQSLRDDGLLPVR